MADFGTLAAECTAEVGQSTATTAQTAFIKQAICEAITFNSKYGPFTWQEKLVNQYLTTADTFCPIPPDFARFNGEQYYVKGDSETTRRRLKIVTLDEVIQSSLSLNDNWQNSTPTTDLIAAVDFVRKRLEFSPQAEDTGDYIQIRYMGAGLGPIAQYVSSAWVFKDPYTLATITDNWTNEWLVEGRYLTKLRALYYLWTRWDGGTDASQIKAQAYLQQWTEELNRLNGSNAKKSKAGQTRKSW